MTIKNEGIKSALKAVLVFGLFAVVWHSCQVEEREHDQKVNQERAEQAARVAGTSEEPGISTEEKIHRKLREAYRDDLVLHAKKAAAVELVKSTGGFLEEHPSLKGTGFTELCEMANPGEETEACYWAGVHAYSLKDFYLEGDVEADPSLTREDIDQASVEALQRVHAQDLWR
ncbi:hypothetical protein [Serratia symbiotica]|uniref:hypothetical protein n=1 Tax=Serratia symbiotica TaxID=138074 RepID=UPI00135FA767|nr:hypothetical protein [Serratia symbiotica]MBQ0957271.1 hypothetical protein [Serratia symbiotica]MBQ0957318.1 hypothetical protein [Serratia symbiotica]